MQIGEYIARAFAVVGALGGGGLALWRYCVRPVWHRIAAWRRRRLTREAKLDQLILSVAQLTAEMRPNGGTSLRDAVNRVETWIKALDLSTADIRQGLSGMEERWRVFHLDHARGIVETDSHGRVTWTNRTFRRMTGLDAEALLGEGWVNAIVPELREVIHREWSDAVAGGRDYIGRAVYQQPLSAYPLCVQVAATRLQNDGYVAIVEPCSEWSSEKGPCYGCSYGAYLQERKRRS